MCGLLNCAIANDLDQQLRSFQLFFSENKCSLLSGSIKSPGDLTNYDVADDLEWPLKVNGFIVCISNIQHNVQSQLHRSGVICEQLLLYCRIRPKGLFYDAERDLLAIAKFLVDFVDDNDFCDVFLFCGNYLLFTLSR